MAKFTSKLFEKNQTFFLRLLRTKNNRVIKNIISEAKPGQLRALIYLISDFYLKELEINPATLEKLKKGRRKSLLKKHLGNKKKLRELLRSPEKHKEVLISIAPVIQPIVSSLYSP